MPFSNSKTIIAGPCSVESKEQLFATATQLKNTGKVNILRAGVWKPRTSPNSFEGLGLQALPWLQEIQKKLSFPVTIEVANPLHIEQALQHDIKILWLGARTTVSPFSVQEIADALKGTDATILIKNPINPDLNLWSGATERLSKAGIKKMALIHRGFSVSHRDFRYPPLWHLALQMKERHKDIPMICDPSHICGAKEKIKSVAEQALRLGMKGLMIESHHKPEEAWSDAKQQITPKDLDSLLESLSWSEKTLSFFKDEITTDPITKEIELINCEIEALEKRKDELLSSKEIPLQKASLFI